MTVNVAPSLFERSFAMKIVYPICCGIDVHKDILVATIASTNNQGVTNYLQSSFSSQNHDLLNLKHWLMQNNCFDVAMESTGKYWIPVFNVLEDQLNVYVVHPKYTKAIKGKKTDKKDSKWIADLFKHDLLKFSFIPKREIRQLRELSRYRVKLINMRSSERNRTQNCMTVSNIGLASVLADPFGKTARAIIDQLLVSSTLHEDSIKKLIHGNAKKKMQAILDSINGAHIESDQRLKMKVAYDHMHQLDRHIEAIELEMTKRCLVYSDLITHIIDLPGISAMSAMMIIAEIGVDMTQFTSDKQLCSWAGLAPANNESANKKKSTKISKAGDYLKPLLVQCALSAIKSNKEPYFKIKYLKIKKRRGHKKAIIAIARMLLTSIYHMLLTGESFNPSDYFTYQKSSSNKLVVLTPEIAIQFLQSQGIDISSISLHSSS